MSKPTTKLTWCKARLGEDMNWWIHEISDPVHWDVDGLGIIDPRQFQYLIDLLEPLSDYGLQNELVDNAFYSFGIDNVEKDKAILLKRERGDREMANILALVLHHDEHLVEQAVEAALASGQPSQQHVTNLLGRLLDGPLPELLEPPPTLKLATEPTANTRRYDNLRGNRHVS